MTWLTAWDTDVWPWHAYAEHDTEEDAHRFALGKSREIGGEVSVIRADSGGATGPRSDLQPSGVVLGAEGEK